MPTDVVIDFTVAEPLGNLGVDRFRVRLEVNNVPAILDCRDVLVQGFPVVRDNDQPRLGLELARRLVVIAVSS